MGVYWIYTSYNKACFCYEETVPLVIGNLAHFNTFFLQIYCFYYYLTVHTIVLQEFMKKCESCV